MKIKDTATDALFGTVLAILIVLSAAVVSAIAIVAGKLVGALL